MLTYTQIILISGLSHFVRQKHTSLCYEKYEVCSVLAKDPPGELY